MSLSSARCMMKYYRQKILTWIRIVGEKTCLHPRDAAQWWIRGMCIVHFLSSSLPFFWVLEEYVLYSQSVWIPHQSWSGYMIAEVIEIHEKKRIFHFFSWSYRENWYFCFCKRLRDSSMTDFALKEHLPLQQGLRRDLFFWKLNHFLLREHLPLQQGLRPMDCVRNELEPEGLREHLPLQQGLRRLELIVKVHDGDTQRTSSFTTRIKTH